MIGMDFFFSPPFYTFWDGDSPSSVCGAMEFIASSISCIKPDVIFAHSEGGAAVLSAVLYHPHNVKCLVLVSCSPPFDESGERRLDASSHGTPIRIPMLSVRGTGDPLGQIVTLTENLVDKSCLVKYSWRGGHEVPNSTERSLWAQIAQDLVEIVNNR